MIIDTMIKGPRNTLKETWRRVCQLAHEIINGTGCDITYPGGNKHAIYMNDELDHKAKILYDLRSEQPKYMLHKGNPKDPSLQKTKLIL